MTAPRMSPEERARELVEAGFAAKEIASWGLDDLEAFRLRIAEAIRAAEREAAADLEFYRDREKHIARLLGVADGGQYRADWDGAVARLKAEAADEALERAAAIADEWAGSCPICASTRIRALKGGGR